MTAFRTFVPNMAFANRPDLAQPRPEERQVVNSVSAATSISRAIKNAESSPIEPTVKLILEKQIHSNEAKSRRQLAMHKLLRISQGRGNTNDQENLIEQGTRNLQVRADIAVREAFTAVAYLPNRPEETAAQLSAKIYKKLQAD